MTATSTQSDARATDVPTYRHFIAGEWVDSNGGGTFESKETGNGHREAGHAALDTYTEWKSIYVDFSGHLQRAQIDNQE